MNPNDLVRDGILRYLYNIHKNARGPKTTSIGIRDLQKALKEQDFNQKEVTSNLDYLVQKCWAKKEVDNRAFTTKKGTTQQAERVTYKISYVGIDKLEGASLYQREDKENSINITNIRGVTVVGRGNIVNTNFAELASVLNELRNAIGKESAISGNDKLTLVADIDSIQSQLQKPDPNKSVIRAIWLGIQNSVIAGQFIELMGKAGVLLAPMLT